MNKRHAETNHSISISLAGILALSSFSVALKDKPGIPAIINNKVVAELRRRIASATKSRVKTPAIKLQPEEVAINSNVCSYLCYPSETMESSDYKLRCTQIAGSSPAHLKNNQKRLGTESKGLPKPKSLLYPSISAMSLTYVGALHNKSANGRPNIQTHDLEPVTVGRDRQTINSVHKENHESIYKPNIIRNIINSNSYISASCGGYGDYCGAAIHHIMPMEEVG